ncbi:MAG: hypothetical protein BA869_03435 [Desulfuromonadales bacterium C00003107]|nr:MAG: hypothetical protein BA869_03435 [Desulfuromonadales bacterium C00003107]
MPFGYPALRYRGWIAFDPKTPVSAAERRDFHPEQKDGCLSAASFRPSRIIIPERGNPPQAGQRGATFFCLLFLVVKKSKMPGRAKPADLNDLIDFKNLDCYV